MASARAADPAPTMSMRRVARHALPCVLDGTIVPLVTFTAVVHVFGLRPAVFASGATAYAALVRRAVRGRRIPGVLVLGALGITVRMAVMVWTGSAYWFFVQPVFITAATAASFALTAAAGRPLAARVGADFVPLPAAAWQEPSIRRLTMRLSVVWSLALTLNAALTLWALSRLSVPNFVLAKPLISAVTTVPGIATTMTMVRMYLRRHDTTLGALCAAESGAAEAGAGAALAAVGAGAAESGAGAALVRAGAALVLPGLEAALAPA